MRIVALFVGLDYHQGEVQVCVMDGSGRVLFNGKLANDARLIARRVARYGRVKAASIESCSGAANLAQELREEYGWEITLAHPGFVSRMKHNPDKTDLGDARLLADLVRVGYLPKVWLAPEKIRELRRVVHYRTSLVKERTASKLRIRGLLRENRVKSPEGINPWTKKWLRWLAEEAPLGESDRWLMRQMLTKLAFQEEQVREVERQLATLVATDPVVAKLQTFSGIGPITATMLRAEVGEFGRFRNGKELSRFCGVTPRNASSGDRQADAGLIRAGNPALRGVLIELAHRLARDPRGRWGQLALRMLRQGKRKNVVVAAVANRFVRWLHHQMQSEALGA